MNQNAFSIEDNATKKVNDGVTVLTQEETRQILTPFAFDIDKSLFGLPLATPTKRAIAILIDLLFITLLSDTPGEILALVIAITIFRLGSKKRATALGKEKGSKRRAGLRLLAAFIVFVVLVDTLPPVINRYINNEAEKGRDSINTEVQNIFNAEGKPLTNSEMLAFGLLTAGSVLTVNRSECETLTCWQGELSPLINQYANYLLKEDVLADTMSSITEQINLNREDKKLLTIYLIEQYKTAHKKIVNENITISKAIALPEEITIPTQALADNKTITPADTDATLNTLSLKPSAENNKPVYSIIEWTKAMIEDLGLGFGWAAFYFTAFTALWSGQTPGKKIVGIKVLQLDGTPLSIWDSFGRYGGYGAGLATGLLGFIQILWNPNRQAIQDQISSTVVIDVKKADKFNLAYK